MQIKPTAGQNQVQTESLIGHRLPDQGQPKLEEASTSKVSLSQPAAWISSLQTEIRQLAPVRDEVVAETKAQLKDGSLEKLFGETAIDSLLAEFAR